MWAWACAHAHGTWHIGQLLRVPAADGVTVPCFWLEGDDSWAGCGIEGGTEINSKMGCACFAKQRCDLSLACLLASEHNATQNVSKQGV